MTFLQKITLLNTATLESFTEKNRRTIIKNFVDATISILGADFGFAWWKSNNNKKYELIYKHPGTPYNPNLPRTKGGNYKAQKNRKPVFVGSVKEQYYSKKYDISPYMKSYAIIPIEYKKSLYGNIVVCYKNSHVFSYEEKNLCAIVGNFTAQTITIHKLYERLTEERHNLEQRVEERTAALRESYKKLREAAIKDEAVLSSIGEGILATDGRGNIILMNPEARRMLGLEHADIAGKSLFDVQKLYDEYGNAVSARDFPGVRGARAKGRMSRVDNLYSVTEDGSKIPLSITVTPIVMYGKTAGTIQVFRDISKEKEIDRAKSELISLASHQLRTPLSAINWYAEVLIKEELGPLNADQQRYMKEIFQANQKLVELVYDFLNVSRVELGTFSLKMSVINIVELCKGILQEIRPLIVNKKLRIAERYAGQLKAVQADRKVVRLILQNLITNAVKYTPAEGEVAIDLKTVPRGKTKHDLVMVISDTGFGIPEHQQGKIFTKLFRADNAAKLDTEGSGLGLYLVKSFIDVYKGKISFVSQEGRGTTFTVRLPVQMPEASRM